MLNLSGQPDLLPDQKVGGGIDDPSSAPRLLLQLEPRGRAFVSNLSDRALFRTVPQQDSAVEPAPFWPDVFVASHLPWWTLLQSAVFHAGVVAALILMSQVWMREPRVTPRSVFDHTQVTYYNASEYLPPLNTAGALPKKIQKGDPEHAKQPIISVPPEADNREQTIVTPPQAKLTQNVPLPNLVVAMPVPAAVVVTGMTRTSIQMATTPASVIAPPPDTKMAAGSRMQLPSSNVIPPPTDATSLTNLRAPNGDTPAIVEPPPALDAVHRPVGDLNIAHMEPQVVQPALAVDEQRAAFPRVSAGFGGAAPEAVGPPPTVQGISATGTGAAGQIVALGIHPVEPSGPIVVPAGNRRGEFAATPKGKSGASGAPELRAGGTGTTGNGEGNGAGNPAAHASGPAGIYVGAGPGESPASGVAGTKSNLPPTNARQVLLAAMTTPRIGSAPRPTTPVEITQPGSEMERKIFGIRKYYTMMLNMPNLTSAGGSWIIRFAELHFTPGGPEVVAPVATQKVDPAYPASLMRAHVEGTVTLYAVIHSDGSVGDVRVLRGVNERLDENARAALTQWRFRPATKNGEAVALEAVVIIPFSAPKMRF